MKLPVEVQMVAVRFRRLAILCGLLLCAGLSGCGNKGPLTLPEPAQSPPPPASSGGPDAR